MRNKSEQIKLLGLDLDIDRTVSLQCPFCEATHKQVFRLTRIEEGLLYQCKRASCGARGFVPTTSRTLYQRKHKKKPLTTKIFKRPTEALAKHPKLFTKLVQKYRIPKSAMVREGWRYVPTTHSLWLPVRCGQGYLRGGISKALKPGYKPKSISYLLDGYEGAHYPLHPATIVDGVQKTAIISEGILDSLRIVSAINRMRSEKTKVLLSCALMGVHLNAPRVQNLLSLGVTRVIIALDPDAMQTAFKLQREWLLYFKEVNVSFMRYDPKDYISNEYLISDLGV